MIFKRDISVFITLLGSLFLSGINVSAAPSSILQVSFIKVGHGDAALIQDGSGFTVLIDGGIPLAGPRVAAYLRKQGVDDIDVMVATHAHSDHFGGLIEVLQETDIPVHQVLYNGDQGSTAIWAEFAEAVYNRGLKLKAAHYPMTYTWGTSTAYVLNPIPSLSKNDRVVDGQGLTLTAKQYPMAHIWETATASTLNPVPRLSNSFTNDKSLVILLDHRDVEFLFTGDIGASVEAAILSLGVPLEAEILKVAHHGGESSSSAEFLSEVSPAEAIISSGASSEEYPADETLNRLQVAGARIWRTDQSGTVVVFSDGENYSVNEPCSLSLCFYLPIVLTK